MAEIKISALSSATTPLAGTEVVPIVQGGVTKKVTTQDIADLGGGGGATIYLNKTRGTENNTSSFVISSSVLIDTTNESFFRIASEVIRFQKTAIGGTTSVGFRFYLNTTNSLTGAKQIANAADNSTINSTSQLTNGWGGSSGIMQREYFLSNNYAFDIGAGANAATFMLRTYFSAANSIYPESAVPTSAASIIYPQWTSLPSQMYLIVATNSAATDTFGVCRSIKIEKF